MAYLIDGHNLIAKIPGLNLYDIDDEVQLIQILQIFCRQSRKRVEVYFDNAPPGNVRTRKYGLVTAHFVRRGSTADAAIQSRLKKLGDQPEIIRLSHQTGQSQRLQKELVPGSFLQMYLHAACVSRMDWKNLPQKPTQIYHSVRGI
jgi:predicted RNA-binding protein with PIN domain